MGGKDDEHEMDFGTYTTEKPKKPILSISQIVLIVVVAVIGIALFLGMSGFEVIPEEKIPPSRTNYQTPFQCEQWFEEGKFLLNKNYWTQDVNLWSEDDREKFMMLEDQYASNCIVTQEIIDNLPKCTQMYVRIQELIGMMEDRQLSSIPIKEQREYNSNYDEYFKIRCDVIQDEIIEQVNFMNTNKT